MSSATWAQVEMVRISTVKVRPGHRPLDEGHVKELAASIAENGLLQPIAVAPDGELIFGAHRLAAFKLLGREEIPGMWLTQDDLHRRLATIEENLRRKELTVIQRAEQVAEREDILKELGQRAHVGQGRPRKDEKNTDTVSVFSGDREPGGGTVPPPAMTTADLGAEVGLSDRTVRRYTQIAREIPKPVRDVLRDTPIGNSTRKLVALASKPKEVQERFAQAVTAGDQATQDEIMTTYASGASVAPPLIATHTRPRRVTIPDDVERAAEMIRDSFDAEWIASLITLLAPKRLAVPKPPQEKPAGPTGGQRAVLYRALEEHGGMTSRELEDLTSLPHETVSARLVAMEQQGLVTKTGEQRAVPSGRLANVYAVIDQNDA